MTDRARDAFEFDRLMYSKRIEKAKANGWCMHCGGTGFVSHWITNDETRKIYGNVPQEFSMTCPHCRGKDNTNTITEEEKRKRG